MPFGFFEVESSFSFKQRQRAAQTDSRYISQPVPPADPLASAPQQNMPSGDFGDFSVEVRPK